MKISFVTGNETKVAQLRQHTGLDIDIVPISIPEIQSLDQHEVCEHKARAAWEHIGEGMVIVEDSSLVIHSLGKLPGPFIKFFHHEIGYDRLCRMLDVFADRSAVSAICFATYDGQGIRFHEEAIAGHIASEPRGENGFGWDPIFMPVGSTKTNAECDDATYHATSIRRKAAQKLEAYLKSISVE